MSAHDAGFYAGFLETVQAAPDATAVVDGPHRLSFAQLADTGARLATGLERLGIGPGDAVAVWLPNRWEYLALELAVARLDGLLVHLNPRYRTDEVHGIFAAARPKLLVYDAGFMDGRLGGILATVRAEAPGMVPGHVAVIGDGGGGPATLGWGDLAAASGAAGSGGTADAAFAVFVTSGTTARPKLVVHPQRSVTLRTRAAGRGLGFGPGRTLLGVLPLCGVFGFDSVWAMLMAGGTVVLQPAFEPEAALAAIRDGVTDLVGSDTMFFRLLEVPGAAAALQGLRFGAFASFLGRAQELLAQYRDRVGIELVQPYGSSEAQALLAAWRPEDPVELRAFGGGWVFNPATAVRCVDPDTRTPLPPDTVGELEVRGPELFREYLGQPEATRAVFTEDGWFRTGDLGYVRSDGSFVFLSRLKDSLRLGGFLVDPGEIEQHLMGLPGIRAAQVVGVDHPEAGTVAVAFVQVDDPTRFDGEAARTALAARIASYKVPRVVLPVDRFPLTAAGTNGEKIQKAELRRWARDWLAAQEGRPDAVWDGPAETARAAPAQGDPDGRPA
jgi:fatty-acyl-CoA synthase